MGMETREIEERTSEGMVDEPEDWVRQYVGHDHPRPPTTTHRTSEAVNQRANKSLLTPN